MKRRNFLNLGREKQREEGERSVVKPYGKKMKMKKVNKSKKGKLINRKKGGGDE